ncbi:MAG TPA: hypothetical protein VF950_25045 [Planctomycetota bacterium]
MDERFRDALRRNALLADVLAEGAPSDVALRARLSRELARVRRRRIGGVVAALAAAALLAVVPLERAPAPVVAPAAPPALLMEIVSTAAADPRIEIVRTPSSSRMEIVRTDAAAFDLVRDEDLLKSPRVLAIVGHPGAPRRLIVAP